MSEKDRYMKFKIIAGRVILVAVTFLFLFSLRMIPAIGRKVEFTFDRAFNYRMTVEVVRNGDVPNVDKLSIYPIGKDIKNSLPTGLYRASALYYMIMYLIARIPLSRAILHFCALAGSLIFIPVYFLSMEIYRSRKIAYVTALLAGIIPAYMHRSTCYWYRFEMLATPILFTSLLFFVKAFGAPTRRKTLIYSILSAVFMGLSMYVWRMAVLFLLVYFLCFLYLPVVERRFSRRWLLILLVVIGGSLLFMKSAPAFVGRGMLYSYEGFPKAAFQILLQRLGIEQNFSTFTRLVYVNKELRSMRFPEMFGSKYLSLSGVFVFIFLFSYLRTRAHSPGKDILFVFTVFFFGLTMLFLRNKILLGPVVALSMGESVMIARHKKGIAKKAMLTLIAVALMGTGYNSVKMLMQRYPNTKLQPDLRDMLSVIRKRTPDDSVILCHWDDGYLVQTYTGRPTMTDALIENPETVRRMGEIGRMYYSDDEKALWDYCLKNGATHVMVPTQKKIAYAVYSRARYEDFFHFNSPTEKGKKTVLFRLLFAPETLTRFNRVYGNKSYVLYEVRRH